MIVGVSVVVAHACCFFRGFKKRLVLKGIQLKWVICLNDLVCMSL